MIKGYQFSNDGLSEAIIKKDISAVELFVKADININLPDNEGYSALDRAIKVNEKDTIDLLCMAGAETKKLSMPNPNIKSDITDSIQENKDNQTKTNIEKNKILEETNTSNDNKQVEQFSEENKNYVDEKLNELCQFVNANQLDNVAEIINTSNQVNELSYEGLAPIHYAVFNDNPAMIHLLLNAGADVNIQTNDGLTPLDIAILNGQKVIVRLLLEYGAAMSENIAKELKKFDCPMQHDELFNLYDATYDDIFEAMKKIKQKIDEQLK